MPQRGPIPQDCATLAVYLYFSVSVFELFLVLQFAVSLSKQAVLVLRMFCTTAPCFRDRSSHTQVSLFSTDICRHHRMQRKHQAPVWFSILLRCHLQAVRLWLGHQTALGSSGCSVSFCSGPLTPETSTELFPWGRAPAGVTAPVFLRLLRWPRTTPAFGVTADPGSLKLNLKPICHK